MDNNIQISAGGTSILPSSDGAVVDYEFPPTNYQSAPQPTQDICDCDCTTCPYSGGGSGGSGGSSGGSGGSSGGSGGSGGVDIWIPYEQQTAGSSFVISAGHAYKLDAVGGIIDVSAAVDRTAIGHDAYLSVLCDSASALSVSYPLVLMDALSGGKINNCIIKFRGSTAYMYVENLENYTVTMSSGSALGSIKYGVETLGVDAVSIDPSLNNIPCYLDNTTAQQDVAFYGNGASRTVLTGAITAASCASFTSLTASDVVFTGGTASLSDTRLAGTFVNSGAVVFSGHNLLDAIVSFSPTGKTQFAADTFLTGAGTILMGSSATFWFKNNNYVEGLTFTKDSVTSVASDGALRASGTMDVTISNCTISGMRGKDGVVAAANQGGRVHFYGCRVVDNTTINRGIFHIGKPNSYIGITSCIVSGNVASQGGSLVQLFGGTVAITDCDIDNQTIQGNNSNSIQRIIWDGSNTFGGVAKITNYLDFCISSGCTLDFTGNPGDSSGYVLAGSAVVVGGFVDGAWVADGSATVITSGGATVAISGSGTKLDKDGILS